MIKTIETPRLENKKQIEELTKKINLLENNLQLANVAIEQINGEYFSEKKKTEALEEDLRLANDKLAEKNSLLLAEKNKNNGLDAELKLTKDKVTEHENILGEIAKRHEPENLIREAMNEEMRVDGSFLRYILRAQKLE